MWGLDLQSLLGIAESSRSYANAKVVLVGDTGVGKTGLGLVLTGKEWKATESTHGRHVWTFADEEVEVGNGSTEQRETILWDLAGQPGYRLVHQLHLGDVAAALVVFDARSESDPFAGVRYWDRALCQARRARHGVEPLPRYLVGARADRGGLPVTSGRIQALVEELELDGYFETSAKEGWGVEEVADKLRGCVPWDRIPKVTSSDLFQQIKAFLLAEKKAGLLLTTPEDLYRAFVRTENAPEESATLEAQFQTCIDRVEARGLIRRLSFGGFVLLQPELLDAYASAMVNVAKSEPDGLGFLVEEDAASGRFRMAKVERVEEEETERLLLLATVEEMLRHEIVLREPSAGGMLLVFPSQLTREWPEAPDPEGKAIVFGFDGPVMSVYATLAVRLSRSGLFASDEKWRNAVRYSARTGGGCGLWLRELGDGRGELTLFFDEGASEETRFHFEGFVQEHLERRALPGTILRRRVFVCSDPECQTPVTDRQARLRRKRGFDYIDCNVCGTRISLLDHEERLRAPIPAVDAMQHTADTARIRETNVTVLEGKRQTNDYDVFISYSSADRTWVKDWLIPRLEEHAILACVDYRDFDVGISAIANIELAVERCPRTLVVLTPNWEKSEWTDFEVLLAQADDPAGLRQRVLPVLLVKCRVPKRLGILTYADMTERATWETELQRIVDAVAGHRRLG